MRCDGEASALLADPRRHMDGDAGRLDDPGRLDGREWRGEAHASEEGQERTRSGTRRRCDSTKTLATAEDLERWKWNSTDTTAMLVWVDEKNCMSYLEATNFVVGGGRFNITVASMRLQKAEWNIRDDNGLFHFAGYTNVVGKFRTSNRLDLLRGNSTLTIAFDPAKAEDIMKKSGSIPGSLDIVPSKTSSCTLSIPLGEKLGKVGPKGKAPLPQESSQEDSPAPPVAETWSNPPSTHATPPEAAKNTTSTKIPKPGSTQQKVNGTADLDEVGAGSNGTVASPAVGASASPPPSLSPLTETSSPPAEEVLAPSPSPAKYVAEHAKDHSPPPVEVPSTASPPISRPPESEQGGSTASNVPEEHPAEPSTSSGTPPTGNEQSKGSSDKVTTRPSLVVFVVTAVLLGSVVFCVYRTKDKSGYQELEMSGAPGDQGERAPLQPGSRFQLEEEDGDWGEEDDWQDWSPSKGKKAGQSSPPQLGSDLETGEAPKPNRVGKKAKKAEHKD